MSRHIIPITPEIKRLYQVVVGYDNPLKTFFFQVWDSKEAEEPINNSFAEFDSVDELMDALNDFLGNVIGKTYNYPMPLELLEQLYAEQCLGGSNVVKSW